MKKQIQISVGSTAQALDRFEQAWRVAAKGAVPAAQVRLTFESLPALLKNLTPARWTLLERLRRDGRHWPRASVEQERPRTGT